MSLDFSRCRPVKLMDGTLSPIKKHVEKGVELIVKNPYFFNMDEMGNMKTAQTIISAQFLYLQGIIDRVIVVAPASVRGVWFDKELGELQKHLWEGVPVNIHEFHSNPRQWNFGEVKSKERYLQFFITNYEFIRSKTRLIQLLPVAGPKTLLVLDESSYVKNYKSKQTEACVQLRKACGRVLLLNGTPIANSPEDLFSQVNLLHPSILDCKYITHYRARYAIMEVVKGAGGKALTDPRGNPIKTATGWKDLPDLQQRIAPYCIRRLKKDCLDLPSALPPVNLYVPLEDRTWAIYKEMRDEMVVWLEKGGMAAAAQAAVKVIRLAQITSGFVGGIEDDPFGDSEFREDSHIDWSSGLANLISDIPSTFEDQPKPKAVSRVQQISSEKLDFLICWHKERLLEDTSLKLLTWCRFRPELERIIQEAGNKTGLDIKLGAIYGGQSRKERETSLRLLDPRTAPPGPVFFVGTYGTGALGINLTASHTVVNLSFDYSYFKWLQTLARVDRPGQVNPVSYFNIIATGPKGQKTINHDTVKVLMNKEDIDHRTTSAWVRVLKDE